jgi:hypothetical protein
MHRTLLEKNSSRTILHRSRAGELIQIQSKHITKKTIFYILKINTEKNKHSPIRYIPINTKTEPEALQILHYYPYPNDLCFPPLKPEIKETSFLRLW